MVMRKRRPTLPGVILRKYYLEPRSLGITRFAEATGLTRKHVSNIVHGKASVSPETAVRFAQVLGTTPQFWLNLQNAVDVADAERKLKRWRPASVHRARAA
jgi:addiction module HigA family antidote